jgi:hypothetical protein
MTVDAMYFKFSVMSMVGCCVLFQNCLDDEVNSRSDSGIDAEPTLSGTCCFRLCLICFIASKTLESPWSRDFFAVSSAVIFVVSEFKFGSFLSLAQSQRLVI